MSPADPTPELPPTPAPPLGAPLGDDELLTPAQQRIVFRWLGALVRWLLRGLKHPSAALTLLGSGTTIAGLYSCGAPSAASLTALERQAAQQDARLAAVERRLDDVVLIACAGLSAPQERVASVCRPAGVRPASAATAPAAPVIPVARVARVAAGETVR